MRGRVVAVASVVVLALAACSGDRVSVTSTESSSVPIGDLMPMTVVSGVDGYSWMLGYTDTDKLAGLYRLRGGQADRVMDVGVWDQGVMVIAFGESVVVGGVRCASVDCDGLVMELVAVATDKTVTRWGVVDSKSGAPDDALSAQLVGRSASRLWIRDLDGELLALDARGRVTDGPIVSRPWTELCVIGSDLYQVEDEDPPPLPPTGEAEHFTHDPHEFSVSRWERSGFVPVPRSRLPRAKSPGPIAFCAHDGFEVPGAATTARWDPDSGWRTTTPVARPSDPLSAEAQSSTRRRYVVDSGGALLALSAGGPVDLGLHFTPRRDDGPPLPLVVDDANHQLIACLVQGVGLECHTKRT